MRVAVVVAFAMIAVGMSGCVGGIGTITAKSGLDAAESAAVALAGGGDPILIEVGSLEPFSEYVSEEDDFEMYLHLDETPGDGIAPGWMYGFIVGDDVVIIGYSSGLGVIFEARQGLGQEVSEEELEGEAISGWKTDSDDAAKALKAHPDWPTPKKSDVLFWSLYQDGACPIWAVELYPLDDILFGGWTEGLVNACTGEVIAIETHENEVEFYTTSDSGTALYPAGELVLNIEVGGERNAEIDVDRSCFGDDTAQSLTMILTDDEGEVIYSDDVDCGLGNTASTVLSELAAGSYTLTFEGIVAGQVSATLVGSWFE